MTVEEKFGKTTEELKAHIDKEYGWQLKYLRSKGYNPIGVSRMLCEDTFVFETEEETAKACQECDGAKVGRKRLDGWWYNKEYGIRTIDEYEERFGWRPPIFWIDSNNHITGISE